MYSPLTYSLISNHLSSSSTIGELNELSTKSNLIFLVLILLEIPAQLGSTWSF